MRKNQVRSLLRQDVSRYHQCAQLPALKKEECDAILFHGSVSTNCKSSVRCMGEKLSSEISVKIISPDGVW